MAILGDTITTKLTTDELNVTGGVSNSTKTVLLDLLYPVGSIYVFCIPELAIPDTCPIANTLGGTWVKIENRFLYSTTDADKYGQLNGSNKATLVEHIHQIKLDVVDYDTNTWANVTTSSAGTHGHRLSINRNGNIDTFNAKDDIESDYSDEHDLYRVRLQTTSKIKGAFTKLTPSYPSVDSGPCTLMDQTGSHVHVLPRLKVDGNSNKPFQPAIYNENLNKVYSNSTAKEANMPAYLGVIA